MLIGLADLIWLCTLQHITSVIVVYKLHIEPYQIDINQSHCNRTCPIGSYLTAQNRNVQPGLYNPPPINQPYSPLPLALQTIVVQPVVSKRSHYGNCLRNGITSYRNSRSTEKKNGYILYEAIAIKQP